MYKILGGDGKEYGPISADTVRLWISEGRANAQTQVLPAGGAAWVVLGQLPEFTASFSAPAAAASYTSVQAAGLNPLALIGFILSMVAITVGLCCCYGLPFNIGGIVCSAIGLVQIRNQPERYTGRGLAIAGIIIGVVSILLAVVLLIVIGAVSWGDFQKQLEKP